jgi:hypothetical protein
MAEKTIKVASFWYSDANGLERTALRGDTVDLTDDADVERGERLGAFATVADLKDGSAFADFLASRSPTAEAGPAETSHEPTPAADKPGRNDSREKWADYARSKGAPEPELVPAGEGGLSRDALRDKYGS